MQARGIGLSSVLGVSADRPSEEGGDRESFENAFGGTLRLVRQDGQGGPRRERLQ